MQVKKEVVETRCGCGWIESVYSWDCLGCMVRKTKMLRSKDGKSSKKLQEAIFNRMGEQMAEQVKAILKRERAQ